jgi:hypothetical protein
MVDRFGSVRLFAHYEHGISQLAVRDPGLHCRDLLWLDLAEEQFDICFGDRSRAGRYDLAFFLQDGLSRNVVAELSAAGWDTHPRVFCKKSLELLENNKVEFSRNDKESATASG